MKNTFILLTIMILFTTVSHTQEEETERRIGTRIFSMYVESAFGDSLAPDLASSALPPCMDMKATYMHMLPNIPWLGFSFTAQVKHSLKNFAPNSYVPGSAGGDPGSLIPNEVTVGGAIHLGPIALGVGLSGKVTAFYIGSWKMPTVPGVFDHKINVILEQGIMLNGTGYIDTPNGPAMSQYIIPDGQARLQYLIKPVNWFGIQFEAVLLWFPILHASGATDNVADIFALRLNPRFLFYPSNNWNLFAEPRLFIMGFGKDYSPLGNGKRLVLEFKVGLSYNMAWFD